MAGYKDDKSKVPTEAELEAMLDQEPEEDFGQTELEVASVDQRAVLKEWTAQDFANIYTRFRPHLERHARRFLRNPSQVDEVVQDAFLYLMVTLPELDSELGVLRFLKWKVRLLCLDVIRASGKAYLTDIDEHGEFKADQPEVGSDLERAEDAAIVRMALAKLQPRHREVLIASIYEEKSTLEIAAQVNLTENATRQLLLRARSALKRALVGEVNTQGMSLSQILSVAAKKAAADARQNAAKSLSIFLFALAGLSVLAQFDYSSSPQVEIALDQKPVPTDSPISGTREDTHGQSEKSEVDVISGEPTSSVTSVPIPTAELQSFDPQIDLSPFNPWRMDDLIEDTGNQTANLETLSQSLTAADAYTLFLNENVWLDFTFDPEAQSPIGQATFSVLLDDVQFTAYPGEFDYYVEQVSTGYDQFHFRAYLDEIYDSDQRPHLQTRLTGVLVNMNLVVDPASGTILAYDLDLAQTP